jgi:hypothetical protein
MIDPRHADFLRDIAEMVAKELYAKRVQRAGDPEATVDPSRRLDHSAEPAGENAVHCATSEPSQP